MAPRAEAPWKFLGRLGEPTYAAMHQEDSESDLIARAVAGDELAFKMLLHAHFDRLEAHVAAKLPAGLRSVTDPADVRQETFIQGWRHIRNFEPIGNGALYAWLVKIADRKLLDRIKSHNARKRGSGEAAVGSAGADSSAAELLDVLADAAREKGVGSP